MREYILNKIEFILDNSNSKVSDAMHGLQIFLKYIELDNVLLEELSKVVDYYVDKLSEEIKILEESSKVIFSKLPPMCVFEYKQERYVKIGSKSYDMSGLEIYTPHTGKCKYIKDLF